MFPVTITLTTPAQLNAVMAALGAAQAPELPRVEAPAPEAVQKTDTPKETKKGKPAAAPTAPSEPSSGAKAASSAPAPAESPAPAVIDYPAVGAAITAYAAAHGRQATLAKLAEFGVKSGKELNLTQYPAALAAFKVEA